MKAREELYAALMSGGPHSPDRSELASARIDAYRTTVLNGTEVNPSPLVMDAQAYRWLADEISKTMVDGDRWDGDDSEEEILARYVRWLAAEREQVRAEVLREVAVLVDPAAPEVSFFGRYGAQIAAWLNMLAAKGEASPAGPTATQPADFYQVDHTYRRTDPEWAFRCDMVTTHPEDGERTALGWRYFKGQWAEYAYGPDDWEIAQLVGDWDHVEQGGAR